MTAILASTAAVRMGEAAERVDEVVIADMDEAAERVDGVVNADMDNEEGSCMTEMVEVGVAAVTTVTEEEVVMVTEVCFDC